VTEHPSVQTHQAAVEEVLRRVLDDRDRVVSVDSPPGAGKSELVIEVADRGTAGGSSDPIGIISQTNEQADDLTIRLAARFAGDGRLVGRLHSEKHDPPARVSGSAVRRSQHLQDLTNCDVIVAPAAKWAYTNGSWHLGIIDEAYQMRSDALLPIGDRFDRLLAVGDPGQLDPFTTGDERLVRGLPTSPIETAAETLHRNNPHQVVNLPVSWRLTPAAAALVSPSFYARQFGAAVDPSERALDFGRPRGHRSDPVWDEAAATGWALAELPAAHTRRTDPEAVELLADLVEGLLVRGGVVRDGSASKVIGPADIAVGLVHRDQRAAVRAAIDRRLTRLGVAPDTVTVDTANRLQGRQFEVTIAWHPLSGRRDASTFHLEAGRLCVLLSRHRQACILVARAGIAETLRRYPATDPITVSEPFPLVDGWEANLSVLELLEPHRLAA
jgi:AAA domain